MANITMTYGAYNFSPVPFLTINKDYETTEADERIGSIFRVTLDGMVTPLPSGTGGYSYVDTLQDQLRAAFTQDGQQFKVMCDSTTLISAYPRVKSIQFSPSSDNWVQTSPYNITMEWDEEPAGSGEDTFSPYIKSARESWNLEYVEEGAYYSWDLAGTPDAAPYKVRLSHNVSAVGKRHYVATTGTSGGLLTEAWQQARAWVIPRLGYDSTQITSSGVINLTTANFSAYNHVRTQSVDETSGEFSVTENWLVINPSGSGVAGKATEDFSISIRTSVDSDLTTVSIEGSIQGLENRSYGTNPGDFNIIDTKYTNASGYWSAVQSKLLGRVNHVVAGSSTRAISSLPKSKTVGHNATNGTITYAYEYDDRPCNFVSGALSEIITINDNNPTDIFASIVIPGRAYGPILQSMSTVTAATREVSVEVVMPIPTGCASGSCTTVLVTSSPRTQVENLLCCLETELTGGYSQVFKSQDNASWNPKSGRYSRTVQWTYTNCSGSAPNTSFC